MEGTGSAYHLDDRLSTRFKSYPNRLVGLARELIENDKFSKMMMKSPSKFWVPN